MHPGQPGGELRTEEVEPLGGGGVVVGEQVVDPLCDVVCVHAGSQLRYRTTVSATHDGFSAPSTATV